MTDQERLFAEGVRRQVTLRLIPLLILIYILAHLDRVNVSFAALTMNEDLGFSDAIYGMGAGLFFFGYFLFEVPANKLLERIGARRLIGSIMLIWGTVSAAMATVSTPFEFYVMRFVLGVAESGLYPGIILYLTYWFRDRDRATAPLVRAPDAHLLDTTILDIEAAFRAAVDLIDAATGPAGREA